MNRLRTGLAVILLAGSIAGCGSASGLTREATVPVNGTATYQGTPLPGYLITFVPVDGRRSAGGLTDSDGKFQLGTNSPGDGCPPGRCKVSVAWGGPPQEEPGNEVLIEDPRKIPKAPIKLPATLEDPNTSGLEVEVPAGGLRDYALEIK